MDLQQLRWTWDTLGRQDPLWAILADPAKEGGRWDLDEFFASGARRADAVLRRLGELGRSPGHRLLDFGCGVGRVTQGFAAHVDRCVGVDIAESMVEEADRLNRVGDRVRYVANHRDDLALFPDGSFDLVFSMIVLQHMPEVLSTGYLREFFRVCAPGGTVVFQVPSEIIVDQLPAGGFSAAVTADVPARLVAGRPVELPVTVRNTSAHPWPGGPHRYLALGNHWLAPDGAMVRLDDGRAPVSGDVEPGDALELVVTVTAPDRPGAYLLELDLVQEEVAWFAQRGSATLRAAVEVEAGTPAAPDPAPDAGPHRPAIDMFPVPRETVLALVASCGGRVLAVDPDDLAPDFTSFTYYVANDGRP